MYWSNWLGRQLHISSPVARVALAEFLGTCILIIFGDGSVAQSVLSGSSKGGFISINWSWCMAVMLGALSCVNVSGGHINPAVSLAMALIGRLKWSLLPVYMLAQYLGAFVGAAVVYMVYYDAIMEFDHGMRVTNPINGTATAAIFSTFPQPFLTVAGGLGDQIIGTMMLVLSLMAITDKRNANVPKFLIPVFAGLTVFVIGAAYGYNCGYAINPARDLSPRIFTAMAGWGNEVFSFNNYKWFWVPVIGPHIGAVLGSLIYLVLIEFHWDDEEMENCSKLHTQTRRKRDSGEDNEGLVDD